MQARRRREAEGPGSRRARRTVVRGGPSLRRALELVENAVPGRKRAVRADRDEQAPESRPGRAVTGDFDHRDAVLAGERLQGLRRKVELRGEELLGLDG